MIKIIKYAAGGLATTAITYNYLQRHYELDLGLYDATHNTLYR